MSNTVISIENVSKSYQLGVINTGTFRGDLQRWWAKQRGLPDPHLKIGEKNHGNRQGETLWALKDINFQVQQGEVLGIIGRNGAGKSTLLKILSRVTAPTTGECRVKGRIASLLEVGTGFHPELTGRENIYLNGAILGMSKAEISRKFDEIVAFSGVEQFIDTPVKRYSSGMYVRLAFAVAAHLEPEILLVDEVLSVGDAAFQKKCLGKMGDVAHEGRTVLFVSHNMAAVQKLCEMAYLLEQGHIIASGSAMTVVDAYYKATMDRENSATGVRSVPQGTIRYLSWCVKNSSTGDPYSCYTGGPCTISLQLGVRRIVKEANFGIALWASDGSLVWAMRNLDHGGQCVFLQEGLYELKFAVPSFPLRPGAYQILVSANDLREGTLDEWYAQPKLQILHRNESGLPPQWQGLLNISGQFKLSLIN